MTQVRFYRGNDASQTLAPQGLPTLPVEWQWNPSTSKFSWKNEGAKKGWVNLIRKNNTQYIQSWMTFQEPLSQLFARLSDWAQGLRLNWSGLTTLGWFPIDQGEVTLQPGLQKNESLVFVQVETSENVLKPDEDVSLEPQLFSLAEGLVIKSFDALK